MRQTERDEARRGRATFYSVAVLGTAASFESGKANALFTVDGVFIAGPGNYGDLSPDGKQFVTFADLKQRIPVK